MHFKHAFHPARALHAAWIAISQHPGVFLIGGLCLMVTDPTDPHWGFSFTSRDGLEFLEKVLISAAVFLAIFVVLVLTVLHTWMYCGFAAAVESACRQNKASLKAVFTDPEGRFRLVFLASLLQFLLLVVSCAPALGAFFLAAFANLELGVHEDVAFPAMGVAMLVIIPLQVWFVLGLMLMRPAAAYEGLSPMAAMRRSLQLVKGNRMWFVFYNLVTIAVLVAGFCFCLVGVLFTYPWTCAAGCEAYLALVREDRSSWWLEEVLRERAAVQETAS